MKKKPSYKRGRRVEKHDDAGSRVEGKEMAPREQARKRSAMKARAGSESFEKKERKGAVATATARQDESREGEREPDEGRGQKRTWTKKRR